MRRACRPSPAWLRWAVPVCAVVLLAPRPAAAGQCDGPEFGVSPFLPALAEETAWGTVVGDFYGPGGILDGIAEQKQVEQKQMTSCKRYQIGGKI